MRLVHLKKAYGYKWKPHAGHDNTKSTPRNLHTKYLRIYILNISEF